MPIKKDGSGKRWVEMEFVTPGTPEDVWHAIATGPGNAAWFTQAVIEEKVGGALRFVFGPGMSSSGEVTIWQPPHRFGYVEREWSEGAPPVATEVTITSRSGGRCVVRMVHSLFTSSDDWDDQMEGFESGWPGFFEVLRVYLSHFAGQKAASVRTMISVKNDQRSVWKQMTAALGLAGADVGEHRTLPEPEPLSGTIEYSLQSQTLRFMMMRLDESMPGIAMIGTYGGGESVNASVIIFFYGDEAENAASASQPKWQDWLATTCKAQP